MKNKSLNIRYIILCAIFYEVLFGFTNKKKIKPSPL
jgi:hypothetical protein